MPTRRNNALKNYIKQSVKMNNKEAQMEAIKKAWEPYWSSKECPRLTNSQRKEALENDGWVTWMGDKDNMDFNEDLYLSRPKSLRNFKSNNGWIRIKEDGSNLPDTSMSVTFLGYTEMGSVVTLFGASAVRNLWKTSDVTHYKIMQQEKPPIW